LFRHQTGIAAGKQIMDNCGLEILEEIRTDKIIRDDEIANSDFFFSLIYHI
jgi:hypothetical protein